MKFAKAVFYFSGGYGVLLLPPLYFMEKRIGTDAPPAITHPEYFYGFLGVAFACQIMFLLIARDPVRFRPMMFPAMIEKFSFALVVATLYFLGRAGSGLALGGVFDALQGVLFIVAFILVGRAEAQPLKARATTAG